MTQLPLFPLNMVVFPGMPVPLHIFEARYKEMINGCIEAQRPFGIVLIEQGRAEGDTHVRPYRVGCTVHISQVERLPDGRLFIMTVGQDRFRIHALDRQSHSYLSGDVELLHLEPEETLDLTAAAVALRPLVLDYLRILAEAGNVDVDVEQVPEEPQDLAYVSAALLNIELEKKQALLESNRISALLAYLQRIYKHELHLLRLMPKGDDQVFSAN